MPASGRQADGQVLEYTENGELEFGSHRGPACRSLIYRRRPDGAADVRFADGRDFYRLDLRSGSWQAEHPCRADQYLVTVTRLDADSFTETWQVTGPDKDYELTDFLPAGGRNATASRRDRRRVRGHDPAAAAAAADRDGDGSGCALTRGR